ncbi:MAG: NAD(P)/FAD-dependent oxidoreductase [Calditrichaeota bacterium]|nr:NAD(P)/FAD-dependent oxidoreductase [Calditrichota bacterium]
MNIKKSQYQVAVVGAGPAGSSAVISCKNRNLSVVLIDKAVFPRDKVCGDGIPLKTFNLLEKLGFSEEELFKDGYKINRLKVYSPQHKVVTFGNVKADASTKSGCIPRKNFDNNLFKKAAAAADSVMTGYKVLKIEDVSGKKKIILKNVKSAEQKEIIVDAIVAADGANSNIARMTGLLKREEEHYFDGLRWYYEGKKFDSAVHLFYDRHTLPGYVWVFPVAENKANVGIMINKKYKTASGKTIREIFLDVIENNPNLKEVLEGARPIDKIKGAPLPLGTLPGSRITNGLVLIGDAAAFINPVTGGGIYYSVLSAMKAAEVLETAISNNDVSTSSLAEYENWWREEILPGFEYSDMLKRWFDSEKFTTWFLNTASWFKPFANFFIMVYGRPLPKRALWHPLFWARVLLQR